MFTRGYISTFLLLSHALQEYMMTFDVNATTRVVCRDAQVCPLSCMVVVGHSNIFNFFEIPECVAIALGISKAYP